jgi:hypothetical protein
MGDLLGIFELILYWKCGGLSPQPVDRIEDGPPWTKVPGVAA